MDKKFCRTPYLWRVIYHHDKSAPPEFTNLILRGIFHIDEDRLVEIIKRLEDNGSTQIALYTKEVAQTKETTTNLTSEGYGFGTPISIERA